MGDWSKVALQNSIENSGFYLRFIWRDEYIDSIAKTLEKLQRKTFFVLFLSLFRSL